MNDRQKMYRIPNIRLLNRQGPLPSNSIVETITASMFCISALFSLKKPLLNKRGFFAYYTSPHLPKYIILQDLAPYILLVAGHLRASPSATLDKAIKKLFTFLYLSLSIPTYFVKFFHFFLTPPELYSPVCHHMRQTPPHLRGRRLMEYSFSSLSAKLPSQEARIGCKS